MDIDMILDYVREHDHIRETILLNEDHDDPNWNPSMESVADEIADTFDLDFSSGVFGILWDRVCDTIRSEA